MESEDELKRFIDEEIVESCYGNPACQMKSDEMRFKPDTSRPGHFLVPSNSHPNLLYIVGKDSCTCPAFKKWEINQRKTRCIHIVQLRTEMVRVHGSVDDALKFHFSRTIELIPDEAIELLKGNDYIDALEFEQRFGAETLKAMCLYGYASERLGKVYAV